MNKTSTFLPVYLQVFHEESAINVVQMCYFSYLRISIDIHLQMNGTLYPAGANNTSAQNSEIRSIQKRAAWLQRGAELPSRDEWDGSRYSPRVALLVRKGSAVTVTSGEKLGKLKLEEGILCATVGSGVGLKW